MKKTLVSLLVAGVLAGAAPLFADVALGIWLSSTTDYPAFEAAVGKKHAIVQYALNWDASSNSHTTQLNRIDGYGAVPMCVWGRGNAYSWSGGGYSYATIAGGAADTAIKNAAKAAASFNKRCIFAIMEFNHQDNANCYLNDPSGSASGFGTMWQHIVQVFDSEGATKVEWAWIPNYQSAPNNSANNYHNYYPGAGYVDWVGALGFDANWGGSGSAGLSFDALFGSILSDFNCTYSDKPQIIGWFGTAASGSGKESWVQSAYGATSSYPNLMAACYHNSTQGSFDYRIWGGQPASVTNAYAAAISPVSFVSDLPPYVNLVPDGSACGGGGKTIDLTANKSTFGTSDYISVTANVTSGTAPFYPYVRIKMADGRTLYYVRDRGFTEAASPYLAGGPFSPASPIYGYQVLAVNFSGVATGQYILEGYATTGSGSVIGSIDQQTLTVN